MNEKSFVNCDVIADSSRRRSFPVAASKNRRTTCDRLRCGALNHGGKCGECGELRRRGDDADDVFAANSRRKRDQDSQNGITVIWRSERDLENDGEVGE